MRAVVATGYGGPEVLRLAEAPTPRAGQGELLIRVRAAAVNPADWKWRSGMFAALVPLSFPHILGYDVAGEVVEGDGFAPGTPVAAMLDPVAKGGYAEYAVAKAEHAAAIPDLLPYAVAAAIPTAGLTGTQLIERGADVQPGERVLITGALGAVGRFALFAARERGARIVVAVRRSRVGEALALGAEAAVALGEEDWTSDPFDHAIDTVGGDAVAALCRRVRPGGRIVTAATTPIPAEGLPATPQFYSVYPSGTELSRLVARVAAGEIEVQVARTMPLAEAAEAQRLTEQGGLGGKIVLIP